MFRKDNQVRHPLSINDLLRDVLALVQAQLEHQQIRAQSELQDEIPQIVAERVQLQQVILNLIMNAIEAMSGVTDRERHRGCYIGFSQMTCGSRSRIWDMGSIRRNRAGILKSLLYHQGRGNGHGAFHLQVDRRGTWRPAMGGAQCSQRILLSCSVAGRRDQPLMASAKERNERRSGKGWSLSWMTMPPEGLWSNDAGPSHDRQLVNERIAQPSR